MAAGDPDVGAKQGQEPGGIPAPDANPKSVDAAVGAGGVHTGGKEIDAGDNAREPQAKAEATTDISAGASSVLAAGPAPTAYFDLLKAVVTIPNISAQDKLALLSQLKGSSPTSDRLTYRTAIWILGAIALLTIGAIWHLSAVATGANKVPEGLIAIASGAVGGLAGLLSAGKSADPPR